MPSVACVIIAAGKRTSLLDTYILPSVLRFRFAAVVVVGEYHDGQGYKFLHVPGMVHNTNDALVRRDIGTLATQTKWLLYLSDDHALAEWGGLELNRISFDILVPRRFCTVHGSTIDLNMGCDPRDPNRPYCGGHAGLFRRRLIVQRPWSTMPHDRLWDLYSSRIYTGMGAHLAEATVGFTVEDCEPEARPWQ